ncbi:hypothetical protein GCM10008927_19760 [Amylibacter ulvae]|uniref:Lipoprotein n=1 Tax=Paramylibacter ulvae TaxID=1651968 RepID=A0ABQ3D3I0_9RHOB|nr:hypothetical protein GCM10008927_19760 [Amylibacter ulvae]
MTVLKTSLLLILTASFLTACAKKEEPAPMMEDTMMTTDEPMSKL